MSASESHSDGDSPEEDGCSALIDVRRAIEAGLADVDAGRTVPNDEVRRRFGLPPSPVMD